MADFEKAIEKVLMWEGGLTDDKNDSGGLTKFGISHTAYPNVDIANLTIDEAKKIYKRDYWDKIKGDEIQGQAIAEVIFDFGVNAGVETAVKTAQRICRISDDGVVGDKTISALNNVKESVFMPLFIIERIRHYINICKRKPSQRVFLVGWIDRTLSYAV